MARATTKTSTRSKLAPEAPKKKLGRPLGSKNKVKSTTTRKTATRKIAAPAARRATVRKSAPAAAPRMSKAELESHVVKLERSLTRARKQIAAFKLELGEANDRIEAAEARQAVPKPAPKAAPKASPKVSGKAVKSAASEPTPAPARSRRKKASVAVETDSSDDVAEAEAETEAHAS